MPNYRHGISNAVIAMQTAVGVYGTPWNEVGAESVENSPAESNSSTFYSDNGKPATVNSAGGNDTINVQFASFSKDFQTQCLGHGIDKTTGAVVRSNDDERGVFAFGYEVNGTSGKIRVWKLGCTSSEPTASFATDGENVTEAPDSATFTVNGDMISGTQRTELTCHEGDAGFATFLSAVPSAIDTSTD
jgi:phi13 family phage major tail protein